MCNNLNYRNRMAQYAGRASVALNTHLFFKGRTQEEEGSVIFNNIFLRSNDIKIFSYVLFVRKNALQVLIPKFGLEGTIYVSGKKGQGKKFAVEFIYNEEVSSTFFIKLYFLPSIAIETLPIYNNLFEKDSLDVLLLLFRFFFSKIQINRMK